MRPQGSWGAYDRGGRGVRATEGVVGCLRGRGLWVPCDREVRATVGAVGYVRLRGPCDRGGRTTGGSCDRATDAPVLLKRPCNRGARHQLGCTQWRT